MSRGVLVERHRCPQRRRSLPSSESGDPTGIHQHAGRTGRVARFLGSGPSSSAEWSPCRRRAANEHGLRGPQAASWRSPSWPPRAAGDRLDGRSNVESLQFSFDGFKEDAVRGPGQDRRTYPSRSVVPVPDVTPLRPPLGQKDPVALKWTPLVGLSGYTPIEAAVNRAGQGGRFANVISGQGTLDVVRYGVRSCPPGRSSRSRAPGSPTAAVLRVPAFHAHDERRASYKQSFTLVRKTG